MNDSSVTRTKTFPLENVNEILASNLGSPEFKKSYGLKYAYYSGSMYRGIASKELVVCMGKAGLLGFLGTAGLSLNEIERDIDYIQKALSEGQAYGMNLLCHLDKPEIEMSQVALYLNKGIRCVEAAAFMEITKALAYYHISGLSQSERGEVIVGNKVLAKISRPETAKAFMSPVPLEIVKKLLSEHKITPLQADLSQKVPVSCDVCVEADSGGHTDQGIALALFPAIKSLKDELQKEYPYPQIRLGLAGAIGTPEAVAAAFMMGADFICTGSVNQCTVESGMSDVVKGLLQEINIQDTEYTPAGDMFKIGARAQVLKKGTLFPVRANKLFMLYNHYDCLDDIPEKIQRQIQEKYFKRSFAEVFSEIEQHLIETNRATQAEQAKRDGKYKMELVFCWYFHHTMRLSFDGDKAKQVDFQVHCGPALGAFNQWVKGTSLEPWQNRHVDEIAEKLMSAAATLITQKYQDFRRLS